MQYKETFKEFDFNREFEAVVIDNENFDENYEVKLFVFELMMTTLQDTPRNIEKNLDTKNIINIYDIKPEENVNIGNYLVCQPLIDNDKEKTIRKPDILDKVILRFHNGNPKLPYYIDKHFPKTKNDNGTINLKYKYRKLKGNYYRLLMYREENMKGKDVDTVGIALEGLGYSVNKYNNENYIFDREMLQSLLKFQSENNLKTDGDIGPITFSKLKEKYNSKPYLED